MTSAPNDTDTVSEDLRLARAQINALRAELSRAHEEMQRARRRAEVDRQALRRLTHQLAAIRRSRSWQVTRPLRAFRRAQSGDGA